MPINNNIFSVITARSGSKGIRDKNLRTLCGKPLLAYSIEASLACPEIVRTILSTDSLVMADIGREYGIDVQMRPTELARDDSRSEDVLRHVLMELEEQSLSPDSIVLLQPTSPLRTGKHLSEAISLYRKSNAGSCMGITESEHHPYKGLIDTGSGIKPLFSKEHMSAPRQSLPIAYRQNGAVYIVDTEKFLVHNTFYIEPVVFYVMPGKESIDIDCETDLVLSETYMRKMLDDT
jgi:CMP-N-acetylneuraminic acid synthetase